MQFNTEVIFKTEVKEERNVKLQQEKGRRNGGGSPKKVNIVAHNGNIVVNSIIARLEPFNEELVKKKDFSI